MWVLNIYLCQTGISQELFFKFDYVNFVPSLLVLTNYLRRATRASWRVKPRYFSRGFILLNPFCFPFKSQFCFITGIWVDFVESNFLTQLFISTQI